MKKIYILLIAICLLLICSCGNEIIDTDSDQIGDKITLTVEYQALEGGYIQGEAKQSAETTSGLSVEFKTVSAEANEGYIFVEWSDGNKNNTRSDILSQNSTFTAIFEKQIKITYGATEGGMISGYSKQYLKENQASTEVEAVADNDYRFIGWSDGYKEAKRSDIATENASYIAMFEKIEYSNISYLTTEGGLVEGMTQQRVENGTSSLTVKATPMEKGYYFVKWDDGILTPERSDIVTENKTVTAIFSNMYKVVYEATEGGRIEGAAIQELEYGKSFEKVMAVANKGYVFVRWDDGSEVMIRQDKAEKIVTYKAIFKIPHNISYTCDSEKGTLYGSVNQTVPYGENAKTVTAIPNEGYEFICWSDGTLSPEITVTALENTDLHAYFSPKSTGLPVISINTEDGKEITSKTEYIGCNITLLDTINGEHFVSQPAQIRGRGNSTWNLPKQPYKIKLESKQDFFDNGKAKTWVLLADHRDYSLVRNMLAFEVGEELSELKATPDCQSVEIYLNGKYHGVYLLCEQIEVNNHRVEVSEDITIVDTGYLVEMDGWTDDVQVYVPDNLKKDRRYTVKFPESDEITSEQKKFIENYLKDCIAAIQGSDYERVLELIDVKSFAQGYIIYDLFKNPDTNYSSLYFYKDAGGKLICGPLWDFDMSVGNVSHKGGGVFESTDTLWSKKECPWFNALLNHEEFVSLVGEELKERAPIIRDTLARKYEEILLHADAYKKNFERWDVLGKQVWSSPHYLIEIKTWEEHIEYIKNYLEESLKNLEKVYCNEQN